MPTINRELSLADGETASDVLQGTVISNLDPGIHRVEVKAAADADVDQTFKVDSDLAIDDGKIFPTLPLNPQEDAVFRGIAEGGSNLLYSVSNESGSQASVQVQFEVTQVR